MPLRDALGVEGLDLLGACEPARSPFLTGDVIRRRAAERARICGQQEDRGHLTCGQHRGQALMESIEQPFERFPQVADEMPPLEDLFGFGCAKGGPARRRCRAGTAHADDAWMCREPRHTRSGRAVRPQRDRPLALHVDQQGASGVPPTHGPIIDPKDGRRGQIRQLADEPPQSIRAGGHMELGAQPRPGFATTRALDAARLWSSAPCAAPPAGLGAKRSAHV